MLHPHFSLYMYFSSKAEFDWLIEQTEQFSSVSFTNFALIAGFQPLHNQYWKNKEPDQGRSILVSTGGDHVSRVMRKPSFCICKNKDADQLCGNRTADQPLCFRYIASTIPHHIIILYFLNTKFPASSLLL